MSSLKNRKVCFISPYPEDTAPGQRFRYEQYTALLKQHGFVISFSSFLSVADYEILYTKGNSIRKTLAVITGFIKRLALLFSLRSADFVFLFREASPVGPPVFEWFIAHLLRKKIIYDFDDAIWLTDKINESRLEKMLRWRSKVSSICKWSYRVSAGNQYLCNYALQFNKQVVLNPTTIETENLHNRMRYSDKRIPNDHVAITIGWTGSHSTLKYLQLLEPVLQKLEKSFAHVRFLVIADRKPSMALQRLDFLLWNKEKEAEDLLQMDIGIMPLPNDEWTKGKCGFKALQYMAMEIPCVVSPIGVNSIIVEDGVTGFLATTETEWLTTLTKLIEDKMLREQVGKAGRKKVIDHYSVSSNQRNFLSLFE